MNEQELKEELLKLLKEKAVIRGSRTLASGKKSDYYIDGKQITLDSHGLLIVGKLILSLIHGTNADAVGGPTLGADPLASAVALLSSHTGKPLKAFIVRKEAKKHGMQKMIEGPLLKLGDKVVIVEDVITTGGSVLTAIQEVEKIGAKIVKVICLVDRNEGAFEKLSPYNYSPIFTLSDLGLK
ncbi:MAG: orotate phosphoribosyltransferase [Candidatus Omnitrophica bacterium]|nr:orotate phosphoribosyltransferase [Candidatus Omnitrophota bacterium]